MRISGEFAIIRDFRPFPCGEMEALSVESVEEDDQGMIERIGRNHPTDTSANDLDQEFGSEEGSRSRSWSGVSGLVALLLSGGVLFLAWLAIWERSHPAAAAARGIRSEQVDARLKAVHELENLGAEDTEVAIPALIAGLSDSEAAVRAASAQGLVTVISGAARTESGGMDVRDAVKALLECLDDPDPPVRSACTQSLWMIVISWHGPLGLIDLGLIDDAMVKHAGDPDPGVRYSAICGLGMIGPRISDEAPEALIAALEDESPEEPHHGRQLSAPLPSPDHRDDPEPGQVLGDESTGIPRILRGDPGENPTAGILVRGDPGPAGGARQS